MKKILLGLGAVSVAILPMAAMVSCSTPASTELQTELDKFVDTTASNSQTTKAPAIVTAFNAAKDQTAKDNVIKMYYLVPTLTAGYTANFISVTANGDTKLNIEVQVTKTKTSTTVEEVAKKSFVLSGLGTNTPVTSTKVSLTKIASPKGVTIAIANAGTKDNATNAEKLVLLNLLFTGQPSSALVAENMANLTITKNDLVANKTAKFNVNSKNLNLLMITGETSSADVTYELEAIEGINPMMPVVRDARGLSTLSENLKAFLANNITLQNALLYFTGLTSTNLPNLVFSVTFDGKPYTSSTALSDSKPVAITVKGKTGYSVGGPSNLGIIVIFDSAA